MDRLRLFLLSGLFSAAITSCNITGPAGIFKKSSPHEIYSQKIEKAGLRETALGKAWFTQAELNFEKALNVSLPYTESGYFAAESPKAVLLTFEAERGEKITVSLTKKPSKNFTIFADLWKQRENRDKKLLAYADTGSDPFSYEIEDNGRYFLRLQPELLSSGEYHLRIGTGPSMAFPVPGGKIGSFWGADRDNGARLHEGIDIFAPKRTAALASADGIISRVTTNKLGGKVVFMRPEGKDLSLYYAHLDEQRVAAGQKVNAGDTVGLIGNTGNAITTRPHLHFGIYTFGGAINPLSFVNPVVQQAEPITASLSNIGKLVRTSTGKVSLFKSPETRSETIKNLNKNVLMLVQAATSNWYKVSLPDSTEGFIKSVSINPIETRIGSTTLKKEQDLLDKPELSAAKKLCLKAGQTVNVLGFFEGFNFVSSQGVRGWIPAEL